MVGPAGIIGLALGAAGGASLASVILAPFTAAVGFANSYYYGYGLILGERQMYMADWPLMEKRIRGGESFLTVLTEHINATVPVVSEATKKIFYGISENIMKELTSLLTELFEQDESLVDEMFGGHSFEAGAGTPSSAGGIDYTFAPSSVVTGYETPSTKQQRSMNLQKFADAVSKPAPGSAAAQVPQSARDTFLRAVQRTNPEIKVGKSASETIADKKREEARKAKEFQDKRVYG